MSSVLSIRLSDQERGLLDAAGRERGLGPSQLGRVAVRAFLGLDSGAQGEVVELFEALDKRLGRLEEMAGL